MFIRVFGLIFYTIVVVGMASAQNLTKSPYSAIGLGEMHFGGTTRQSGMGQLGETVFSPYEINSLNPASYESLKQTVIEAGALYARGDISTSASKSSVDNFSFSYFKLAFPLSQKLRWGFGAGLEPYSNLGYNVSSQITASDFVGTLTQQGIGGLTRFYGGTGVALYKELSVGFQASYLFGTLDQKQALIIPVEYNKFNLAEQNRTIVRDFQFQYSVQYKRLLSDTNYRFILGASMLQKANLNATRETFVSSMGLGGQVVPLDTIHYNKNAAGKIILPAMYSAGIALERKDYWFVGAEISYQQWTDFRIYGASDSLINATGLNVGGRWTPNYLNFRNFFSRMEYRAGARYNTGNLTIDNTPISTLGFSVGLGVPLGKTKNRMNIGFEYLMKGTTNNGLIKEEYFRLTIGVSMSDKWFNRYKYD